MKTHLQCVTPRLLLGLSLAGFFGSACGESPKAPGSKMLHAESSNLIDGQGRAIRLRVLAFSRMPAVRDELLNLDLTEADYRRARDLGFGAVRLDIAAALVTRGVAEPDAAPGLAWLDQQLAWAKAYDLLLIIAQTRSDAGTPRECVSDALWDRDDTQDELVASWRLIAERYATEPALAGYDLLHEPSPSHGLDQWQALASRLASAIRELDHAHLLILEQAQRVACKAVNQDPNTSWVSLDDPNVLYAFEARGPWNFTTQSTSGSAVVDGGVYPDELELGTVDWSRMTWEASDFSVAPTLAPDETDWVEKKHYYSAVKPTIRIAQVNLRSESNAGTAYFDDLEIDELDSDFEYVRTVIDADLEDPSTWSLWQDDVSGPAQKGVGRDGHRGKASITLSDTTSNANLNNEAPFIFPVNQHSTYRVTGWMKGEHSAPTAKSMIGLSLFSYKGDLPLKNAANLAATTQPFVDWGREHQVPLFVSALGTSVATFDGEKGGLTWVSDMLDVLDENQLGFCYDAYRGTDFGIYPEPGRVTQPLVDLFEQRLPHAATGSH